MRKLKYLLATLLFSCLTYFTSAIPALAANPLDATCYLANETHFCSNQRQESDRAFLDSSDSLLVNVAKTVTLITGAVSVIMIIIGGIKYIIANGDSNALQSAKNTILYALIGLVIAASAQILVSFVLSKIV